MNTFDLKQKLQTYPKKTGQQSQQAKQTVESIKRFYTQTKHRLKLLLRRWAFLFHAAAGGARAIGPISFLLVSATLGIALTLTTLYSTSYAVSVDGETVGIIEDQSILENAIQTVESRGSELLGTEYQVDSSLYEYVAEDTLYFEGKDRTYYLYRLISAEGAG